MVPLNAVGAEHVKGWLGEPTGPGLLDLYQALANHCPGLWGDDARVPRSVLLIRDGKGQLEVFGAGRPEPAMSWLCRNQQQTIALVAPEAWWSTVEQRVEHVERLDVLTLSIEEIDFVPVNSPIVTRRLTLDDSKEFFASDLAPEWTLSTWRTFRALVEEGAGYVVPYRSGFASRSWIYSQAGHYEAIGVATAARFRRLGLGKAVASALVSEILQTREKIPLWTTAADNVASLVTATSLGFSVVATETCLRWPRPQDPVRST